MSAFLALYMLNKTYSLTESDSQKHGTITNSKQIQAKIKHHLLAILFKQVNTDTALNTI